MQTLKKPPANSTQNQAVNKPELMGRRVDALPANGHQIETLSLFAIAILGFSFWYFIAVPFASHRESYNWYAGVVTETFKGAFAFISVTYRPLAQGTTWLGYMFLDPHIFPTSALRQSMLQGLIYVLFVAAWWLIFSAVTEKRLFALIACATGTVCFPSYVHLFHVYALFYVPVMLMLGWVLRLKAFGAGLAKEGRLALIAFVLVWWHPFATALFVGFYFGYYLDTFALRKRTDHIRALAILASCSAAIFVFVILFPRSDVAVPFATKLYGSLITYKTNEVNSLASAVVLALAELAVFSIRLPQRVKFLLSSVVFVIGCAFAWYRIPVLLLWIAVVLYKLARMRNWSLFFLQLTAAVFPIGAVIGSPVFGLFAIISAGVATCIDWPEAEARLTFLKPAVVAVVLVSATGVVLAVRAGMTVPGVSSVAKPLLSERERTYQLESLLEWLHRSNYCSLNIAFADKGGSPIDSFENVVTRRYRPPSDIADVGLFWRAALQCKRTEPAADPNEAAILSFGGEPIEGAKEVYSIPGKYAGEAAVWIGTPSTQDVAGQ